MRPTKHDALFGVILLLCILLSAGGLWLWRTTHRTDGDCVAVITVGGEEYARIPLDADNVLTLPTGHELLVRGGEISVTAAPCPDGICVNTSAADSPGESIVCLPEKVIITITEGTGE